MTFELRPGDHECFGYHRDYVAKVPDGNIIETLEDQLNSVTQFIKSIPADQMEVIHPPYGWKVRTVIEHCCDAERVYGYRALRFAADEGTELPGWDENHFANSNYCQAVSPGELAAEFHSLRGSNLSLLKRLDPKTFDKIGVADGSKVSVRTIAWLMAGHWNHHEAILAKRLGVNV